MKNRWANLPSNIPPQTSQTSSVPQKENNPPKQPPATSNSQPKPISEPIKKEPVKPIEETTKKIIEEKPIIKKEERESRKTRRTTFKELFGDNFEINSCCNYFIIYKLLYQYFYSNRNIYLENQRKMEDEAAPFKMFS